VILTALLIGIVVVASSLGDVSITRGMKELGEVDTLRPRALLRIVVRALSNRHFMAGLGLLALSFFAFLGALSRADMSLVVPATALCYVVTLLGARFVLRERVSGLRWTGALLVCLGVALISLP